MTQTHASPAGGERLLEAIAGGQLWAAVLARGAWPGAAQRWPAMPAACLVALLLHLQNSEQPVSRGRTHRGSSSSGGGDSGAPALALELEGRLQLLLLLLHHGACLLQTLLAVPQHSFLTGEWVRARG
jgi:hypothetical protein